MFNIKSKAALLVLPLTFLILSGCSATPATPTIDPNMIYTAAAQTVQAQLIVAQAGTATAAALVAQMPTATLVPPTQLPTVAGSPAVPAAPGAAGTPAPVVTLSINLTPGAPGAATALPGLGTIQPTSGLAVATLAPTAPGITPIVGTDKGQLINQDPDDGTVVVKNYNFDGNFRLKNTGTTTWTTTDYYFASERSGDVLAKHSWYSLNKDVKPNDTYSVTIDFKSPGDSGQYKSVWCLVNKNNITKCVVYFDITINVS